MPQADPGEKPALDRIGGGPAHLAPPHWLCFSSPLPFFRQKSGILGLFGATGSGLVAAGDALWPVVIATGGRGRGISPSRAAARFVQGPGPAHWLCFSPPPPFFGQKSGILGLFGAPDAPATRAVAMDSTLPAGTGRPTRPGPQFPRPPELPADGSSKHRLPPPQPPPPTHTSRPLIRYIINQLAPPVKNKNHPRPLPRRGRPPGLARLCVVVGRCLWNSRCHRLRSVAGTQRPSAVAAHDLLRRKEERFLLDFVPSEVDKEALCYMRPKQMAGPVSRSAPSWWQACFRSTTPAGHPGRSREGHSRTRMMDRCSGNGRLPTPTRDRILRRSTGRGML